MGSENFEDGAGPNSHEQTDVADIHAAVLREQDEPNDGFEPTPTLWIIMALSLTLWAGWYLGKYSQDFIATAYDGDTAQSATAQAQPDPGPPDPMVLGRRTFVNCVACHQNNGEGVAGQFPPLAGSEWVLGDPSVLARILLHGMTREVTVKGEVYNGVMPAWERLGDAKIAAVLTYIRASWGNNASAVEPDLIAEQRQLTSGRTDAWSAQELKGVP